MVALLRKINRLATRNEIMFEIIYPETRTYWIAATGDNIGYGKTESHQITTSGAESFQTFTDEDEWLAALAILGIVPGENDI